MYVKGITDEDLANYKKPSMFIAFPSCTFKCEKECGERVCQNSALVSAPNIDVNINEVIERYLNNPLTSAVICAGLEPFDSFESLFVFVVDFREKTDDDIVIYTGYTERELSSGMFGSPAKTPLIKAMFFSMLTDIKNITIKFGRYVPGQEPHYDEVLGVDLASDNQYAKRIS